jgi:hypothetical protein
MSTYGVFPKSKSEGTLIQSEEVVTRSIWPIPEVGFKNEHKIAYNIIIDDLNDEVEKLTEQVRKLRYSEHKLQIENEKLLAELNSKV